MSFSWFNLEQPRTEGVTPEKSDFEEPYCFEEALEVSTMLYFRIRLEIIFNLVYLLYRF